MASDPIGRQAPARRVGEPVQEFLRILKGKYKADILIRLGDGPRRFSELRRAIPGISERMLTRHLHDLERDGVIARAAFPEIPPRVEYRLTAAGSTLCPIIKQMWTWGRTRARPGATTST